MQMNEIKVSVIIPVYNADKYLIECLDSIINQRLRDIEIICINDGSTDNSPLILEDYQKKDSRIIIISQNNQGISAARNAGLEIAKGSYIYFIDSDDFISDDYLEKMYKKAIEKNADIIINDNIMKFYGNNINKLIPEIKNKFPDGEYIVDSDFIKQRYSNPTVWSKLYKRENIINNNIKFPLGLISEDAYFFYTLFPFIKTAIQYNIGNYYYRLRKNSLTHQKKKLYCFDSIKIFEKIYNFYKQNNLLKDFELPYRLIAYRSSQCGDYIKYKKELLKTIKLLNIDIEEMKKDKKLSLLLNSRNRFTYSIKKILKKGTY